MAENALPPGEYYEQRQLKCLEIVDECDDYKSNLDFIEQNTDNFEHKESDNDISE